VEKPFPAYKGDDPYVFVCYAHADDGIVYPEIQWLHDQGFNVWYDEGIDPGSKWRDEVALALTQCRIFLYFVSPRSVASANCLKEVNFCLSRERKILSVHLEETEFPLGLEFSLSDTQAIMCRELSRSAFEVKLVDSLKSLLPAPNEPDTTPREDLGAQTPTDAQSVAVIPLVNRSGDLDNEYLSDGITEELINGLSRVPGLKVAPTLSSFACKGLALDVKTVGEKLAVATILSGSMQKSGNRIRINVRLDKVADGSMLWSERYDRELVDIFELQDDVARSVIDALKVELGAHQKVRLVDVGTQNMQAYDAFLLGMHEYRKTTRQSLEQAIMHFQRVARMDAGFGRVFWFLYTSYLRLIREIGLPRKELALKAEEALNRAKAAGFLPPVPWIKARRDLFPEARPDQRELALEASGKIRQPDPEWQSYEYIQLGDCFMAAGLNHGACDYYEYYLDLAPHDLLARFRYRCLLAQLGRFDRAIDCWTEFIATQPDDPIVIGERALLYSRTGQYEKAEQDLAVLSKVFPRNFPQFYHLYWCRELDAARAYFSWLMSRKNLALLYKYWGCFLLGDIEDGINHLEEAVNQGADPAWLRVQVSRQIPQSRMREVEQHPRFQAILKPLGIDDAWRDDLMELANDLTDLTGIHVQLDEAY